jgi:hypothetical protein
VSYPADGRLREDGGMRRVLAAWALVAAGSLLLVAGLTAATLNATVLSSDGFADAVSRALEEPPVAQAVGARVGDAVIAAEPDLVAARPLVDGAGAEIAGSAPFRALVRGAAADLHRSVFERDATTVALVVTDVVLLVSDALAKFDPQLAERLPENARVALVDFSAGVDDGALAEVLRAARAVRLVAWLAFPLAVLAFAAAALLAPDRGRGLMRVAIGVGAAGLLAVALTLAGEAVVRAGAEPDRRDAAGAIWDAFFGGLRVWGIALVCVALIVAAANATLVEPRPVLPFLRRVAAAAAQTPASPGRRVARALALVAAGALVLADPLRAARVAALAAGLLVLYVGVAELLRVVVAAGGGRAARRTGEQRATGRAVRRGVAVAGVLVLAVVGTAAIASSEDAPPFAVRTCNGHRVLCDRAVTGVTFAATHNAMAAAPEPGWLFAAQDLDIPSQLERGVRALMLDTHYGVRTSRGVYTALDAGTKSREKIEAPLGAEFVATAERLRERIGFRGGGRREVWLCHAYCEVGATRAVDALADVREFLVRHPGEVVVLSLEDSVTPGDMEQVMRDAGVLDDAWTGAVDADGPTLREMIDAGRRLLVMAEEQTGGRPWLKAQFELVQETPYAFATPAALEAPESCAPNRGRPDSPMLLLNHWVDTSPAPRPTNARRVNARAFLLERARRCERERKLPARLVAVDFAGLGDLVEVVDELNGVRR